MNGICRQSLLGVLVGAALLFAACENGRTPATPGAGEGAQCATHSACQSGLACLEGSCESLVSHLDAASQCATNADCAAGALCRDGLCVAARDGDLLVCTANADCPDGTVCYTAHCVVLADAATTHPVAEICGNGIDDDGDGQVNEGCGGQPCASGADCAAGLVCMNGQCAANPAECATTAECPAGLVCMNGQCAAYPLACASDADCAAGLACLNGQCAANPVACATDADCAPGQLCDATTGTCHASTDPVPEICGNEIDDDGDGLVDEGCEGEPCTTDADCAAGLACMDGQCTANPLACVTDADCASGLACLNGQCAANPVACATDADCTAGQLCDATTGTCQASTDPVPEICGNEIDDDGDGLIDEGCDGEPCTTDADCAAGLACRNGLCATDALPCATNADCAAGQVCVNALCAADSDGDGVPDAMDADADNDGFPASVDCDDTDPSVYPGAPEICGDGRDNNCNGLVDEGC